MLGRSRRSVGWHYYASFPHAALPVHSVPEQQHAPACQPRAHPRVCRSTAVPLCPRRPCRGPSLHCLRCPHRAPASCSPLLQRAMSPASGQGRRGEGDAWSCLASAGGGSVGLRPELVVGRGAVWGCPTAPREEGPCRAAPQHGGVPEPAHHECPVLSRSTGSFSWDLAVLGLGLCCFLQGFGVRLLPRR